MQDDEAQKTESDNVGESEEKRSTEPIQEATFSTHRKKVRRKLVESAEENAQVVPFKINSPQVSSREVLSPPLRVLKPDSWEFQPPDIEALRISAPPTLGLPRVRIWEEARLKPLAVNLQSFSPAEIGLPPRPLYSVLKTEQSDSTVSTPQKEDTDSSSEEVPSPSTTRTSDQRNEEEKSEKETDSKQLLGLDEFLFEILGESIGSYDPLCIVAAKTPDEEYRQTLETLCREQFRQLRGGKPLANLLAEGEEDELENVRVENRIISYDDDSGEEYLNFKSRIEKEGMEVVLEDGDVDLSKLHNRIDEFFTETLGYLLLFVADEYALTLYEHLTNTDSIREPTQLRFLRPRLLPDDVKRELVQLAWGNVPVESTSAKLDRLFQTAEAEFKESLQPNDPVVEVTAHNAGEESLLHYWVKCLVVEYLLKLDGLTPIEDQSRVELKEKIPTEIQLGGGQNPIPDVYHNRSQEVFEVETLYGSHHKKITKTVDKYEGVNVKRVNVVLPNLALLRNLSAVLGKTQEKPGEMFRNEVKFWTLNVVERELIPLDQVTNQLADLQERGEKFW
jgi:hypothetical protein